MVSETTMRERRNKGVCLNTEFLEVRLLVHGNAIYIYIYMLCSCRVHIPHQGHTGTTLRRSQISILVVIYYDIRSIRTAHVTKYCIDGRGKRDL